MIRTLLLLLLVGAARGEVIRELGLPQAAADIAKEATAIAAQEGGLTVEVGDFTNDSSHERTDAAIRQELIRALGTTAAAEGQGGLRITGSISLGSDADGQVVEITAKVTRKNGQVLKKTGTKFTSVNATVKKISHQLVLFPNTSVLPPAKNSDNPKDASPGKERFRDLGKKVPAALRTPTEAMPHEKSQYAVELRTKKTIDGPAAAQTVTLKDGLATIPPIMPGDLYEVRILNYGMDEAAATLHIDGIDGFEFTDDRTDNKPNYTSWILSAAKDGKPGEVVVKGWHKGFKNGEHHFLGFMVTEYGQGAVSKIKSAPRGNVGLIQVGFAKSHPPGTEGVKGRGGETGFGPPTTVKGSVVERLIDPPTEFLAIRYQRNLGEK